MPANRVQIAQTCTPKLANQRLTAVASFKVTIVHVMCLIFRREAGKMPANRAQNAHESSTETCITNLANQRLTAVACCQVPIAQATDSLACRAARNAAATLCRP